MKVSLLPVCLQGTTQFSSSLCGTDRWLITAFSFDFKQWPLWNIDCFTSDNRMGQKMYPMMEPANSSVL